MAISSAKSSEVLVGMVGDLWLALLLLRKGGEQGNADLADEIFAPEEAPDFVTRSHDVRVRRHVYVCVAHTGLG